MLSTANYYFATERKLEKFKSDHPETKWDWRMHEIDAGTAWELAKLSKKKVRVRCQECGK